ncbi:MAG: rhomboid family intramembrane serine protease [Deltaproteobacteria bacterium]|nr:MAG: rhomboid family intramembrane serine protease [Deltaproteobacteria bacterium]
MRLACFSSSASSSASRRTPSDLSFPSCSGMGSWRGAGGCCSRRSSFPSSSWPWCCSTTTFGCARRISESRRSAGGSKRRGEPAMRCTKCEQSLVLLSQKGIPFDFCFHCEGTWVSPEGLALFLGLEEELRPDRSFFLLAERFCPACGKRLYGHPYPALGGALLLSCKACGKIWLEANEIEHLQRALPSQGDREDPLEGEKRAPKRFRSRGEGVEERNAVSHLVWFFQFLTGFPMEVDHPVRQIPLAVISLIVADVVIFLVSWFAPGGLAAMIERFGFVPGRSDPRHLLVSVVSSMFLHAGVFHLLGNLYFLYIFGDNLECRLGRLRFLWLYFTCGVAAIGLHAFLSSDPSTVVGASGAISGLLGAYLITFPHVELYQFVFFFRLRISIRLYAAVWFGMQLLHAWLGIPGVAWFAHIGGFLTGAMLGMLWRFPSRR